MDISGPDGVPDGKIDDNDRTIKGQTTPKWIGGLTNTFTYKDFTLSIFIQTTQGLKKNNSLIGMAGDEMGRRNTTTEIGYWTRKTRVTNGVHCVRTQTNMDMVSRCQLYTYQRHHIKLYFPTAHDSEDGYRWFAALCERT